MMELHAILEHRRKVGYNTPSFIKWVNTSAEENVKIFFINEIRLYNETESAPTLAKQINARSVEIRSEAIKTLGKLKYKEVEPGKQLRCTMCSPKKSNGRLSQLLQT